MKKYKEAISIIGLGYVGLATAVGFGSKGHRVIGIDINQEKVDLINKRDSPIFEKSITEALSKVEIYATTDYDAILHSNISFICVETPSNEDGSISLETIKEATKCIAEVLRKKETYHLIVVKSTIVPSTTEEVIIPVLQISRKLKGEEFGVCVNPEFLREGNALHHFLNPDRIVIGELNKRSGDILEKFCKDFNAPILRTDLKTAEMIKYASNAFLVTKVSFINEIGNLCKRMGIDAYKLAEGMGYDKRIGRKFLNAGVGVGGSCLPKDLKALIAKSREEGYEPGILQAVLDLNRSQPLRAIGLLKKHIPELKGKDIGLLGLSFKPETDDIRDSSAIPIVEALLREGANVKAYDPAAMPNFAMLFPQIQYVDPTEVLNCEAVIIVTEWDEFNSLNYEGKIVIDGRRIEKAREAKIYEGICW